ncbi:acyl--CoA ligase [Candidatus Methylospira mobilis]|uniref:Acyl--CoA ligase n=1 Tax=Candidatus Methylospira mobilis TaxID=1808979 RepID=A0A5Q0BGG1_9GAMM|nr:AMP-binding protein [Candidatus Methylospira mobilis]QFY41264.1 acyl--CoA ligase [Candidatus Methylospira mobilis]WNV05514.1 AMP-binding protein [Candidatus Methylospira mobilis]
MPGATLDMTPTYDFDFPSIEQALWRGTPEAVMDLGWLEQSRLDSEAFWKALHAYWACRQAGLSKSMPFKSYDFYHDLLARQKERAGLALIWLDGGAWREYSVAELMLAADRLAATWENAGAGAGETVAILHQRLQEWLPALLAGLRLGMVVSLLPQQGSGFLMRRLQKLEPQWIAAEPLCFHQLPERWRALMLPAAGGGYSQPAGLPYRYPASATVALCFDPTSPTPDIPRAVDADTLYLGALRDGVLALGVRPGQFCAAPGWHILESQPSLVLAALMSGGGWVDIELADLKKMPGRLFEQPIDILGICRELRDLLAAAQLPSAERRWRHWFRSPSESNDLFLWQDLVARLRMEKAYSGNAIWNAASGGAIVFSARCRGTPHYGVIPAAGVDWRLGAIAAPELPSVTGNGCLTFGKEIEGETVWAPTPHILSPFRGGWQYLGFFPSGRSGRTYPFEEVMEALNGLAPYMALIEAPDVSGEGDIRYALLIFGSGKTEAELRAVIQKEMGCEFMPDVFEFLPLVPKLDEQGKADQDWCRYHYLSGELYRRQRKPLYRGFSELKQTILTGRHIERFEN